jgi:hypothetical protein
VRRSAHSSVWMFLVLIVAGFGALQLSACSDTSSKAASKAAADEPSSVEPIKGTRLNRVTLSAKAAERLGIETAKVRASGKQRKVIPYASVLYTPNGRAFTYTSPEPRVFVRQFIIVDSIKGGKATLSHGPPVGTSVVTVGSQELFGVEYEVEED